MPYIDLLIRDCVVHGKEILTKVRNVMPIELLGPFKREVECLLSPSTNVPLERKDLKKKKKNRGISHNRYFEMEQKKYSITFVVVKPFKEEKDMKTP